MQGEDEMIFLYMNNHIVCPRSSDPFNIASYNIKQVTISWTYSKRDKFEPVSDRWSKKIARKVGRMCLYLEGIVKGILGAGGGLKLIYLLLV